MLPRIAKIIISLSLSLLSVVLYFALKGEERKRCMYAMLLCTVGDFFMVNFFPIGEMSTYIGAAFFMIGHVIYGLAFIKASKRKNYVIFNKAMKLGIASVILCTIVLGILAFVVPETPQIVMYCLILVYIAVIAFNLASQFSYAYSEKGTRYFLIVAMSLFFVSDFVIFLNMLSITPAYNDFVWATYIPAQLLIILFNQELKHS